MATSEDAPDLLSVIIDLNPIAWSLCSRASPTDQGLSLDNAIASVLVFCNAHLALRHENQLVVYASSFGPSRLLFSSAITTLESNSPSNEARAQRDGNTYQQFRMVDDKITSGVREMMQEIPDKIEGGNRVNLVGALSMALCHINRIHSSDQLGSAYAVKPKPRILILSVTEDSSGQYVPMMNCIFSAQKSLIPIDVCKIYGADAVFLQQACHLTSGSYYKIEHRAGLLQYLITGFLPGPSARKYLYQPMQEHVDLRAACFCHRKIIDMGYVCSVCLSIFCTPIPVCLTCRTKFPMSSLKRFQPLAPARPVKKLKSTSATNGVKKITTSTKSSQ